MHTHTQAAAAAAAAKGSHISGEGCTQGVQRGLNRKERALWGWMRSTAERTARKEGWDGQKTLKGGEKKDVIKAERTHTHIVSIKVVK